MKRTSFFVLLLLACSCYGHAFSFSVTGYCLDGDSLPDQQTAVFFKSRFLALTKPDYGQALKQSLTLVIRPGKAVADREVTLPIGVDLRTVRVRSGEKLLQMDKDYVFLTATNRLRILNDDALTSQHPIYVVYEHPNLTITLVDHH